MVDWTDAAIIAAIVSGVISTAGSVVSNIIQIRRQRMYEKRNDIRNWFSELEMLAAQLRSSSLSVGSNSNLIIDSGDINKSKSSEDIIVVLERVDEIHATMSKSPPSVKDANSITLVEELTNRIRNPKGGSDSIESAIDLKEYIWEKSREIEKMTDNEREKYLSECSGLLKNILWS